MKYYLASIILPLIFATISYSVKADVAPPDSRQAFSDEIWEKNIRKNFFKENSIIEGAEQNILEVRAPYAAEDASLVPISVHTKINQTSEKYIKKMHIFVDRNPLPLVGRFEFTPESGKADLAIRIRVDTFSFVRVIAELNTGEIYMSKSFVRAKGACSAPPPPSIENSKKFLGKIKMKVVGKVRLGEPNLMQVKVSHPNITGMAPIKIGSRVIPPAFFMNSFTAEFNGKPIVKAFLTFAVSMDPALRFYFTPMKEGIITVKGTDTKSNSFSSTQEIKIS